ncbi:MAG: hypothetical protein WC205_07340 [Opitutaceae bacterium]|jgi:hypothetical protein
MKKQTLLLLAGLAFAASSVLAQTINVTTAGVDIGAPNSTTAGTLFQQSGQDSLFWTQDGINAPDLRLIIKGSGNVGVGTSAPSQKLDVAGTAKVGALMVGTSTILSVGYFESSEQAIPGANQSLEVPHGLGGIPKFVTVSLRCVTADAGWEVGDEVMLNSVHMRTSNYGTTCAVNATKFKFRFYGYFNIHAYNSGSLVDITDGKWRLVFRAWR